MLLRFVVSNFLSISDEVEFNMFPGKYTRHKNHIYRTEQVDLLKSTAIYGANGAGKSNLVKAISFLHDIVTTGEAYNSEFLNYFYRLKEDSKSIPTTFEIEFQHKDKYYAYGVSLLNHAIVEEWLYQIEIVSKKETLLFNRQLKNNKIHIEANPKFKKTSKDKYRLELYAEEVLDFDEALIFLLHDKPGFEEVKDAFAWFDKYLFVIHPKIKYHDFFEQIVMDIDFRTYANAIIEKLQTGVSAIEIQSFPFDDFFDESRERTKEEVLTKLEGGEKFVFVDYDDGKVGVANFDSKDNLIMNTIITKHKNVEFEIEEESDGTQRLLELLPAWNMLYNERVTFVIDEIDRSIHPALLKKLIEQFLKTETKGQLVFTTHESNLLDLNLFRQDEIWFAEKDKTGSTRLYSLSEFKPRYDLDIQKGYLNGRFGAIPFLGNLEDLNWEHAEEEQTV